VATGGLRDRQSLVSAAIVDEELLVDEISRVKAAPQGAGVVSGDYDE